MHRLRFEHPDGPVRAGGCQLILRLTLACDRCIRRDREGAGLRRCRHEHAEVVGEWRRCRQLAVTKDYCAEHGKRAARAREQYERGVRSGAPPELGHRRGASDVPSLVAMRSDVGRLTVQRQLAGKPPGWFADRAR